MSRILLISHIFPPAVDGGSRVIYKIGQYFESQKHQTLYLSSDCSSTDDFTKKIKTPCPVKVHRYPGEGRRVGQGFYLPVYHYLRRPLKFINLFIPKNSYLHQLLTVFKKGPIFKLIPFISTTIKIIKFKPDLIIAGPLPTTIILYANFLKKITNLLNHQSTKLLINASFHQTDQDFFQKPLIKTLQQTDYLWTLTQYETDFFIKKLNISPQKIILAGNGIDSNFLIKEKKITPCPVKVHRYPGEGRKDGEGFCILFIGSLSAHKGLDILINSFSLLLKANSYLLSTKLIIAGQKTLYYPEIIKIIKQQPKEIQKNIKFIFNFPQKKLKKIIDSCDVLVLPSNQESFGLVLIEAWARQKPVITTNIPPLQEIITQTKGGLIFESNNITDLTNKINQLIDSSQKRHQLGQNGFNYVKNNYTWSIVGKKISQKILL